MSLVNFIWRLVLDKGNQTNLKNILHNLSLIWRRTSPKKIVVKMYFEYWFYSILWRYIICTLTRNRYAIHKLFLFTRNWHTRNKISEDFQDIYIMKNTLFYINGLKVFTCTSLEITLSKHFDQLNFLELHSCINLWHPINATSHIRNFTV